MSSAKPGTNSAVAYFAMKLGQNAPRVDPKRSRALYERLSHAIDQGLVASCHDCSDGGLGVALAESAFAGGLGMRIDLAPLGVQSNVAALFSESQSRFVVTVRPNQSAPFEAALAGSACYRVGVVTVDPVFDVTGHRGSQGARTHRQSQGRLAATFGVVSGGATPVPPPKDRMNQTRFHRTRWSLARSVNQHVRIDPGP